MNDKSAWDNEGLEHPKTMDAMSRRMTLRDGLGIAGDLRNWPVWLVLLTCIAVFVTQLTVPLSYTVWGFSGRAMAEGRYVTAFASIFMHSGVAHIFMNMSAYLSLAPIVCARFGKGFQALIPYHIFFILCGLAGNAAYWLLHPHGAVPVVGASGAIYGLFGAFFRLDLAKDELNGVFSKPMLAGWRWLIVSNLVIVLFFGGPSILLQILDGHVADLNIPIAWEAHVGGFIAGFFLFGLMAGKGWKSDWRAGLKPHEYSDLIKEK